MVGEIPYLSLIRKRKLKLKLKLLNGKEIIWLMAHLGDRRRKCECTFKISPCRKTSMLFLYKLHPHLPPLLSLSLSIVLLIMINIMLNFQEKQFTIILELLGDNKLNSLSDHERRSLAKLKDNKMSFSPR